MDWPNERYVRLYTRDTTTWKLLDWRAKALLPLLLRKLNRAGVLEVGDDGELGLAAQVELPIEVVEPGIAQLLARSVVIRTSTSYVVPNFLEAQEASQTTAHRSREYRARQRDIALGTVTKRDDVVTNRDETVTPRHEPSQRVTPSLAEPSLAKEKRDAPRRSKVQVPEDWRPSTPIEARWETELERFRNHHRAKGNTFANIDLAWKNWQSRSAQWSGENHQTAFQTRNQIG